MTNHQAHGNVSMNFVEIKKAKNWSDRFIKFVEYT